MSKYLIPITLAVLLLAGIALVVTPCLSSPFFMDDNDELSHIQGIHSWLGCFTYDCYGLFRPIKNLIFYFTANYFTKPALVGHGLSLGLYLVTTFLVFAWLRQWFARLSRITPSSARERAIFSPGKDGETGDVGSIVVAAGCSQVEKGPLEARPGFPAEPNIVWALVGTLTWALAPTQVTYMLWLSSANNLIAISGVLGALLAYERFRAADTTNVTYKTILLALGCLSCYWLALLSYEGAIILPVLILLIDWVRQRSLLEKPVLALYLGLGVSIGAFLWLRWSVAPSGADYNPGIFVPSRWHLSFASAFFQIEHLRTWLLPFGRQEILATFVWGKTTSLGILISAWFIVGGGVVLALRMRKQMPNLSLGVLWFLIALAPMSNLIPFRNGPLGDYYIPLPSIGLAILVVAGLRRLIAQWREYEPGTLPRLICTAAVLLVLCWRGAALPEALQWRHNWQRPEKLLFSSMLVRPYAYRARANLAAAFLRRGLLSEAEDLIRDCVAQAPWAPMHYGLLADIQLARKDYSGARDNYDKAIELHPGDLYAHLALGRLYDEHLQDDENAIKALVWLLERRWNHFSEEACLRLADIYQTQNNHALAIGALRSSLKRCPSSAKIQAALQTLDPHDDVMALEYHDS